MPGRGGLDRRILGQVRLIGIEDPLPACGSGYGRQYEGHSLVMRVEQDEEDPVGEPTATPS